MLARTNVKRSKVFRRIHRQCNTPDLACRCSKKFFVDGTSSFSGSIMDSEHFVPDEGTHLPLPVNIDGLGDDKESDNTEPLRPLSETRETLPSFGISIRAWEQMSTTACSMQLEKRSLQLKQRLLRRRQFQKKNSATPQMGMEEPLSNNETAILESMVHQAMMGVDLSDSLTLPWETGIMATIFSDAPMVPTPELPKVAHSLDHAESSRASNEPMMERFRRSREQKAAATNCMSEPSPSRTRCQTRR